MNAQSPLPTRRTFIKKSLAGAFVASQPLVLSGLLRASGGLEDKYYYTSYPETSDTYTTCLETTDPYTMDSYQTDLGTTEPDSTFFQYY